MTPLFPEKNEFITIQQGGGGSCYLLASLDCILNGLPGGREKIQSMFFTSADGGVTLRIKRTGLAKNLQPENVQLKYGYSYDCLRKEDVFTIHREKLTEIDDSKIGTKTNSLAVKIIERISSYYFVNDWEPSDPSASVVAHSKRKLDGTSTEFVGQLLGIHAHDIEIKDLNEVIKLYALDPQQAIYLSMEYGKNDDFGTKHARHSFRIHRIQGNESDSYYFILRNPWDNQLMEQFSFDDLVSKKARFCIFSMDSHRYELMRMLVQCSEEQGYYVLNNSELFAEIMVKKKAGALKQSDLQGAILRYQQPKKTKTPFITYLNEARYDLIEDALKVESEEPDCSLLSAVREYPQEKIKLDLLQLLTIVTNKAIKLKAQGAVDCLTAKMTVESGLLCYYFGEKANALTRSGQLRYYFSENLIETSLIKDYFGPNRFLLVSLADFFGTDPDTIPPKQIEYFKTSLGKEFDASFIEQLLPLLTSIKTVKKFFLGVQTLGKYNEAFAIRCVQLANPIIYRYYNEQSEQFIRAVAQEPANDFKNWFLRAQDLKTQEQIANDAYQSLEKIMNFPIDFTQGRTIEEQRFGLIQKVEECRKQRAFMALEQTLDLLNQRQKAENLIAKKIQEISASAKQLEEQFRLQLRYLTQLEQSDFNIHLGLMPAMIINLEKAAYPDAVHAAEKLQTDLMKAKEDFLQGKITLKEFKECCINYITEAAPALEEQRGWKKFLDKLVVTVLALAVKCGAKISATNPLRLFSIKHETAELKDNLLLSINKLPV